MTQTSAWIQDFAKNTPLQLDEVTQVFVRLKAFGIDPMNGAMQGIVDQAYKLGGGFEELVPTAGDFGLELGRDGHLGAHALLELVGLAMEQVDEPAEAGG